MPINDPSERERRWDQVREKMRERGLDALIVYGTQTSWRKTLANVTYLTNVLGEGYVVFPLKEDPTLITFLPGKRSGAWVTDWRGGHPDYAETISTRLKELNLEGGKLGIVAESGYFQGWGFPYVTHVGLQERLPKATFEDATDLLEKTRMIKSPSEIGCFERGCEIGEMAIQSVVDTAGVGVQDYEVTAKIMDVLYRNGCEPGFMLLYVSGKEVAHAGEGGQHSPPSYRALEEGDIILLEFDAKYCGYEVQFNQTYSVGPPSKEWQALFDAAAESFYAGLDVLKPGLTVRELDEAFLGPIKKAGFTYTHPAFHGLGLSLEEPLGSFPLQPTYETPFNQEFVPGMVIEFEPQAVSADHKKGVHIGAPVSVTEDGCKLLAPTWKPEFLVV
jgi:Xaa-Pro aminopeptidase